MRATPAPMRWNRFTVIQFCVATLITRGKQTRQKIRRKKTSVHDQDQPHGKTRFTVKSASEYRLVAGARNHGGPSACRIDVRSKTRSPYRSGIRTGAR